MPKIWHVFDISAYALTAMTNRLRPQLNQKCVTQQVLQQILAHGELLGEDMIAAVLAVLAAILDPPTLQHGMPAAGPVLAGATSPFLDPAPNACLTAHCMLGLA